MTRLKHTLLFTMLLFIMVAMPADAAERPNIIFMLSDDQGWDGISVPMNPGIIESQSTLNQTPSLEKLASQGMRFSAAYAPASVCSPTRCSLQTGKSPAQNHWTKAAPTMTAADNFKMIPPASSKSLDPGEITIAELLKDAGYATAHFGKWHLRGGGPGEHGYDEHDGNIGNEYAGRFKDPNPVDIFGMVQRADAFMEKNADAGKPFFIQMSWHALHSPRNSLEATFEKYKAKAGGRRGKHIAVAAITEDLDTGVGRVMEAVDRLGIAENTYIIFMSDNGAGTSDVLRGGKGSVWEGGIRVPMIVRGPGVDPGSVSHARVVGYDWFPTFCQWAGIEGLPEGIEGGSLDGLLTNGGIGKVKRPREVLVFHFPNYQGDDGPHTALILGDLKLMRYYETDRMELFDLSQDLGERNDLSGKMPDEAARLEGMMQCYLEDVGAELPVMNPQYDPDLPSAERNPRPGHGSRSRGGN